MCDVEIMTGELEWLSLLDRSYLGPDQDDIHDGFKSLSGHSQIQSTQQVGIESAQGSRSSKTMTHSTTEETSQVRR